MSWMEELRLVWIPVHELICDYVWIDRLYLAMHFAYCHRMRSRQQAADRVILHQIKMRTGIWTSTLAYHCVPARSPFKSSPRSSTQYTTDYIQLGQYLYQPSACTATT